MDCGSVWGSGDEVAGVGGNDGDGCVAASAREKWVGAGDVDSCEKTLSVVGRRGEPICCVEVEGGLDG